MRYFYDAEFWENGNDNPIKPISIGMVSEDGRELYLELPFDWSRCSNEWLHQNVKPHLRTLTNPYAYGGQLSGYTFEGECFDNSRAAEAIREFVGDDTPELWGYYVAYDHVVLCQLFGRMIDLPQGWPMWTRDLKQLADSIIGRERLPQMTHGEHDALADAHWNALAWHYLNAVMKNEPQRKEQIAQKMRSLGSV